MPERVDRRNELNRMRAQWARKRPGQQFLSLRQFLENTNNQAYLDQMYNSSSVMPMLLAMSRAMSDVYVHLPFKRNRYGANPVEALAALRRSLPLPCTEFNREILSILHKLHDPHTSYELPEPLRSATAFLPLQIGLCQDSPRESFVVTHIAAGLELGPLRPGVEITHWNGMPIALVVEELASRESGANRDACRARAIFNLTSRPLKRLAVPEAPVVVLGFGRSDEVTLEWSVRVTDEEDSLRQLLYRLPPPEQLGWTPVDLLEGVEWKVLSLEHPTSSETVAVGVLRIRSFDDEPTSFVNLLARVVEEIRQQAPLALILDVRGNGGGTVQCGERLLQLFSPQRIEPVKFQYLNTDTVRSLVAARDESDLDRFELRQDHGLIYSAARPLTSSEEANDHGQLYFGRVALVTDPHCYSTTDLFAAGFQDHCLGPVIGVYGTTGGGGASVWTYANEFAGKTMSDGYEFPQLAPGADLRLSVMQCTRSGRSEGRVLEDFGVTPDHHYVPTTRDLLGQDEDLYRFTLSSLLRGEGLRQIRVDARVVSYNYDVEPTELLRLDGEVDGVGRVELLVDGVVMGQEWVLSEPFRFQLESDPRLANGPVPLPDSVELRCYRTLPEGDKNAWPRKERLVAKRKFGRNQFMAWNQGQSRFGQHQLNRDVLYFVAGREVRSAEEALAILDVWRSLGLPDRLRLMSYGPGLRHLRQAGCQVIELKTGPEPTMMQVGNAFALWLEGRRRLPGTLINHEEWDLLPRLRHLHNMELDWPGRSVLLTHSKDNSPWYEDTRQLYPLVIPLAPFGVPGPVQPRSGTGELRVAVVSRKRELLFPLAQLLNEAAARQPGLKLDWDPRMQVKGQTRQQEWSAAEVDLVLSQADLVVTKGDREVIDQARLRGKPCLSVAFCDYATDPYFPMPAESFFELSYLDLNVDSLLTLISNLTQSPADPPPVLEEEGAIQAARQLAEWLR